MSHVAIFVIVASCHLRMRARARALRNQINAHCAWLIQ